MPTIGAVVREVECNRQELIDSCFSIVRVFFWRQFTLNVSAMMISTFFIYFLQFRLYFRFCNYISFDNCYQIYRNRLFFVYYYYKFILGGDPLSHLPIGQESIGMKKLFFSVTPALKGFIINRFIQITLLMIFFTSYIVAGFFYIFLIAIFHRS